MEYYATQSIQPFTASHNNMQTNATYKHNTQIKHTNTTHKHNAICSGHNSGKYRLYEDLQEQAREFKALIKGRQIEIFQTTVLCL